MTSFIYLTIAREFKANYGAVLWYARMQESLVTFDPPDLCPQTLAAVQTISEHPRYDELKTAIQHAVYTEYLRRGRVKFGEKI